MNTGHVPKDYSTLDIGLMKYCLVQSDSQANKQSMILKKNTEGEIIALKEYFVKIYVCFKILVAQLYDLSK